MAEKKINYFARNFADVRTELISFVQHFYPDLYQDFNDASIGNMLIELNAATADMLSFHTDRMFTETQIDYAQERRSIMNIARTLGLKIPGKKSKKRTYHALQSNILGVLFTGTKTKTKQNTGKKTKKQKIPG